MEPVICPDPEPLDNISINVPTMSANKINGAAGTAGSWFTLTPQEIAQWIDRRSRIAFPVAFLVFNCLYWFYVYI